MKRFIVCTVIFIVSAVSVSAQDWVKSFGHREGDAVVSGVVTDSESNILITGSFSSPELVLSETDILQSNGMEDVFIIKYDPEGEIIWAHSFGGIKQDQAGDISIDNENNIYIAGNSTSNAFQIGGTVINSAWPENVFVVKFNTEGAFQWLRKSTKLISWSKGTAVHCEGDQHIYFAGYTRSTEMAFGNINLSLNTNNDKGFYCKMDRDGNFLFADFLGDMGEDQYQLNDITADPTGNIYLAARKTVHTEPDPITFQEYWNVMYFCQINPEGKINWSVEDTAFYLAQNIVFQNDTLFVLGNREEFRMIFNGGTIDTTSTFYFGMYDTDSNKLMGRKVIGALAYDLYADSDRILVTGGLLLDHLELDGLEIHRNSDSSSISPIYQDIFFFETDLSGQINQVHSISGSLEDIATGIWLSEQGDLLYSGMYESALLPVEGTEVINFSQLNTFNHVSGTYYDRRIFSFLACRKEFSKPAGIIPSEEDTWSIYPNPSSGILHIRRNDPSVTAWIRVHDLAGHLLFEQETDRDVTTLNLLGWTDGLFILSVHEPRRTIVKPLMIAH